jgi:hypothetical protein
MKIFNFFRIAMHAVGHFYIILLSCVIRLIFREELVQLKNDRPMGSYAFRGHKFGDVTLHSISEDCHFSNGHALALSVEALRYKREVTGSNSDGALFFLVVVWPWD